MINAIHGRGELAVDMAAFHRNVQGKNDQYHQAHAKKGSIRCAQRTANKPQRHCYLKANGYKRPE